MSQDAFNSLTQPQEANILQLEHSILEKILADGTNAVQKPTRPLPDDECDTGITNFIILPTNFDAITF